MWEIGRSQGQNQTRKSFCGIREVPKGLENVKMATATILKSKFGNQYLEKYVILT